MAKKPSSPTQGSGPLDAEDAALWERIARSAEPLKRGKNRAGVKAGAGPATPESNPKTERRAEQPAPPRASTEKRSALPAPPPLGVFDRREVKQLASGRRDIDARIDLHGMRQREAYAALRGFLVRAQRQGHRHVLVITGKGSPRGPREPESYFDEGGREPGVLRRAVPHWLDEPDLRAMVVGFTQAGPRHGGEGAFYVRLRKTGK
jgi:DNA-nicking Smr family endonuclease